MPVGKYARSALTSLGVWNDVADRLVRADNVRSALAFIARGETPLGIVYETDARVEKRVRVVDFFPADSHPPIVYPVAVTAKARPAARQFVEFLQSAPRKKPSRNTGSRNPRSAEEQTVTESTFRISHAALVAALVSSPVFAASDPAAIEQQLNALQQALAKQQEQLAQQQQEIERLRQQLAASSSGGAAVEQIADDVQQAKLAAQDAPRVTMSSARPTISSADGRSSISLRSVVQLDAAHYGEDADGGAHRLPSRLGRRNCESRNCRGARLLRRRLLPPRPLRLRRHRRSRLHLPRAGRARRLRHRRPGAHQRLLDRLHGLRAVHDPGRRILAAGQHGRRHQRRELALHRARLVRRSCRARWAAPTAASASACAATARAG